MIDECAIIAVNIDLWEDIVGKWFFENSVREDRSKYEIER